MAECTAFSQLSSIPCVSPLKLSSLPPLSSISQDLKGSVLSVQADLASTVFGKNRSRDTPCFSLWPPSNVFSSWKLWNQPLSSSLPPWPTNFFLSFFLFFFFFFELKIPYYLSSTSSWIPQLIPMRWRLSSDTGSMRICVPPTLTFLWASFLTSTMWLGAAWATFFSHKTAQEQQEGVRPLFKCKPVV